MQNLCFIFVVSNGAASEYFHVAPEPLQQRLFGKSAGPLWATRLRSNALQHVTPPLASPTRSLPPATLGPPPPTRGTALYCTALHCTVMDCAVTALHCTVLYCTVLYCTVLCCTVLCCAALHCTAVRCTALHCAVLCCAVLYCTVLYSDLKLPSAAAGRSTLDIEGQMLHVSSGS